MISFKLKTIFGLSILLFVAHGIEEMMTGFYNIDAWDRALFEPLAFLSVHGAMFATFQVMLWLLLVVSFVLLLNERMRLYTLSLIGLVYLFELHHPIKAVLAGGYYPGLITSLLFPILAYFFWKEWIRNYQLLKKA